MCHIGAKRVMLCHHNMTKMYSLYGLIVEAFLCMDCGLVLH